MIASTRALVKNGWIGRVVLMIAMLAVCPVVRSQDTASVSGTATDASGAVIPGATVTVKNVETGIAHSTTTGADGSYRVLSLPVGRYEVTVERTGFQSTVRDFELVVGQAAVIDAAMSVGTISQTVTVTEAAPVVNTTTSETAGLVSEAQVKDLPLNGRSFDNLVLLDPDTYNMKSMQASGATAGGFGNLFVIAGRRTDSNIYYLNGVQYAGVAAQADSPGSVSAQLLGVDAIREFNLLSDNYSAEYGKRSGGQVLIVTQSGTNSLHGTAFEFLRNSDLDARNYFDASPSILGGRIPHFDRSNFGGALGGPIRKDKTFIFGNYEGFRQILGLSNVAIVPDNNARTGLLPCVSVTPQPAGCNLSTGAPFTQVPVGSGMAPFLAVYPQPNGPEVLTPVANGVGGAPSGEAEYLNHPRSTIREDFGTVRLDNTFSTKDSINGAYTIDDGLSATPQTMDVFTTDLVYRAQVASMQEVHVFSPSIFNTVTLGVSRAHFAEFGTENESIPASNSLIAGYPMGGLTVGSGLVIGNLTSTGSAPNLHSIRNVFTERDDVQIAHGKHLFAFGVWFNQMEENRSIESGVSGGNGTFATEQQLIEGNMTSTQVTYFALPGYYRVKEGAWYAEDTWKARHNLTVTAGLRHEFTNGWTSPNNGQGNFPYIGNFPTGIMPSQPVIENQLFTPNYAKWLFEPRLALAWSPGSSGKTAVRAGFGMYANMLDNLAFNAHFGLPYTGAIQLAPQTFPYPVLTPSTTPVFSENLLPSGQSFDPKQKTPEIVAYNLTIERQLTSSLVFDLGYSGSHGYHLTVQPDGNSPYPEVCGGGAQIYPASDFPSGVYPACPTTTANGLGIPGQTLVYTNSLPAGTLWYGWAGSSVYSLPVAGRNPKLASEYGVFVSQAISHFNAMTASLTQHAKYGLTFKANYTWSKSLDDSSEVDAYTGGSVEVGDPDNLMYDYGPSTFSVPYTFRFSALYELPFGSGKAFGGNLTGAANKLVGGWQVNTITTVQGGLPFSPALGFNQSKNGDTHDPDRPDWNPNFTGALYTHNPNNWVNPAAFILQPAGTLGNTGRDSLVQPNLRELDLSALKTTQLTERISLQFRAEGFNVLNRANFGPPATAMLTTTGGPNAAAGKISATTSTSRQMQFGLKLLW